MLRLDLTADVVRASHWLAEAARRRIPEAAARALTGVAYDARDAVRAELPRRFSLRRPWVSRGIGVVPARSTTLQASVYSRDAFMRLQEEGGRKPRTAAIPVGPMAAKARTQVIPRSQWPGRLSQRRSTFYRAGTLFERQGAGLQPLWRRRSAQPVAPRFGMRETVRSVALAGMRQRMDREIQRALTSG
ncbi:hypothetical protein U5801_21355 [Lamprobacter modestohalophilus]|uniref:hypothetical protein n=1 Tax=Lamprobacter modestohalophilus TaxID=1064514 RepID=UPI002ADEDDE0|nr:hypothetical protein [Lamprobacter modestohalophilus]MEA1052332.1 hypothetical protein [Lamprobacter modestohalophilus]